MHFPSHYQHEIESNTDDICEFDDKQTPEQIQDDVQMSDPEDQPIYQGPQTQSCNKALMKVNLLMNKCFQVDEMFSPAMQIARREPMSSLVI